MNNNIANGGLIAKWRGTLVFAQPNEWFLNAGTDGIYYSDRNNGNRIYRKQSVSAAGMPVVGEPCSFVSLFGGDIYYVNEDQMMVYRCSKEGKGKTRCSAEGVAEFGIFDGGTIYVNHSARRICTDGRTAFFADAANQYALTAVDTDGRAPRAYPDIKPSYINIHDNNIYYTDRMKGNTIYRLDPAGNRMTIYGRNAQCLHVIDDWLYFISDMRWKRLSLLYFGEAEEV
jgi:hypothetical protein